MELIPSDDQLLFGYQGTTMKQEDYDLTDVISSLSERGNVCEFFFRLCRRKRSSKSGPS